MKSMKEIKEIMKQELKEEGKALRVLKDEFKNKQRTDTLTYRDFFKVPKAKHDFRHKHIAYCELRGTPRELIEQPRKDNKPNEDKIKRFKDFYLAMLEDDAA